MKITLSNKAQKTARIDGKPHTAAQVMTRWAHGLRNGAGNVWIDDAHEINVMPWGVIIRSVDGRHVTLTK